ncbi:MAG: AAA family ATPase [Chitinophagales bacterium]|nr:AAA family ATPase [Chitinophagales bacterium]
MIKTLLLTDVVDSTALTHELGDERMSKVWIEHDHLARELLKKHNGVEADRTDGFLMLFDAVDYACHYAQELHHAFSELSKKESIDFKARIGIHTGEIILIETTEEHRAAGVKHIEVEGIAKPTAARIMSIARPGQTLLSNDAYTALDYENSKSVSHGYWRMKGVEEPVELFEVEMPFNSQQKTEFIPPKDGEKVYRVHLVDDVWLPVKEIPNNLSRERDKFIGRSEDLHRLGLVVNDPDNQLITVLGPGGTGKTRLSKRFAKMWLGDYPGGAWFCDLAEARSVEGIAIAVAAALDIPLTKGDPLEQLGNSIHGLGRCLLIIDNFEQVVEFAEQTLDRWMDTASEAKFIITSRNLLHLPGEISFNLDPLSVDKEAIALFEARAKERKNTFKLTEDNEEDVKSIVKTLDGMPLAIELAASRIAVLQPRQIRERLKERFKLLAGAKGKSKRQQTLRAAIDWSWELLEEWEKSALAQCSVFDGGFSLEAAEEILDLSAFPDAPMVMDVIHALTNKSLIRSDVRRFDVNETWYGMYVSIHQYCSEKLAAEEAFPGSGKEGELACKKKHINYFAHFGKRDFIVNLYLNGNIVKRKFLQEDLDNIIVAFNRAIHIQDAEDASFLLNAAWTVLYITGPWKSIVKMIDDAVRVSSGDPHSLLRAKYIQSNYHVASRQGMKESVKIVEDALTLADKLGDRRMEGALWTNHSAFNLNLGNYPATIESAEKGLELSREVNDHRGETRALYSIAYAHLLMADFNNADKYFNETLKLSETHGILDLECKALGALGIVLYDRGKFKAAKDFMERSVAIAVEIGDKAIENTTNFNIGNILDNMGMVEQSQAVYEMVLEKSRLFGDRTLEAGVLSALGKSFHQKCEYERAKTLYKDSLEILSSGTFYMAEIRTKMSLTWLAVETEDAKAGEMLDDFYKEAIATGNRHVEMNAIYLYGAYEKKKSNYEEALKLYSKSLEIAIEINTENEENILRLDMGNLLADLGRYDKAFQNFGLVYDRMKNSEPNPVFARLQILWAEAAYLSGDKKLAKENFESATAMASNFEYGPKAQLTKEIEKVGEMLMC